MSLAALAHFGLLHKINSDKEFTKIQNLVYNQISVSEKLIPANLEFSNELNQLVNNRTNESKYPLLDINVYLNGDLVYWNNNSAIDTIKNSGYVFYQKDEGQNFTTIRAISLLNEYNKIKNSILDLSGAQYNYGISQKKESAFRIELNRDEQIFDPLSKRPLFWKSLISISLLFLCIFLFLVWHHILSISFLASDRNATGLLISLLSLVGCNLLLHSIRLDHFYPDIILFSRQFDLHLFHPSIAGFIWNTLFFIAGVILIHKYTYQKKDSSFVKQTLLYLFPIISFIGFVKICERIVGHSDVLINTNQILSYDRYGIVEIVCLLSLLIGIFLLHYKLSAYTADINNWKKKTTSFIAASFLSIPLFEFLATPIPLLAFYMVLLAYHLILDIFIESKKKTIPWAIWWMILYAGFLAAILFAFSFQKRIQQRNQFLDKIYVPSNDVKSVEAIQLYDWIDSIEVIQKITSLPFYAPYDIKFDLNDVQSYVQNELATFNSAFQRDKMDIMIYDGYGNTYFANDLRRESTIIDVINLSKPLSPNCFYNPFDQSYVFRFIISDPAFSGNRLRVYFRFFPPHLKKIVTAYPTNYIVYENNKILKYQEHDRFASNASSFINFDDGKYFVDRQSILVKEIDQNIKIISVEKIANLIKPISLFSFFFLVLGLLLLFITLLNTYFSVLPGDLNLQYSNTVSLRAKIQLIVVLLIIISFLFVGFASFYYFKNILEANQQKTFAEDIEKIQKDIYSKSRAALDEEGALIILSNSIQEIADIHNIDLNVYNSSGQLTNSLSKINKEQLDFNIYSAFITNLGIHTINQFDNRSHYRSFIALKGIQAKPFGYIEVNHREKSSIAERLQDFVSTILNLYVFLFLLAGAFAIGIANSITKPLSVLAEKLKRLKLGKKNERLEWVSRDEIGALIKEYNDMIDKLEESATILAKTERDLAWREMAKQVAHEIKNPLTPMKLSIQHLERVIKADPDNAQELVKKASINLIEQIDSLSQIANEFSNFAKMPQANNEKVNLNEVVEVVHDLFRKRDDIEIKLVEPIDEILVFADKNHLIRILNNLVKNAIQAIPTSKNGQIDISLIKENGMAKITVKDNGVGIPESMKNKVFTPNFTTKNSGTGLGLAICANMIESFNGTIYFKSKVDFGSTFFVEIPLLKTDKSFNTENRVSLD